MKFLRYLLLVAITLLGVNSINAQKVTEAKFQWSKGQKCLSVDGVLYRPINPSIFVNGTDTIEKLQHGGKKNSVIIRGDYLHVATIKEPLAFKNSECTSSQLVDLYKKKKFTPKDAPEVKIIVKDSLVYDWCIDSVFIDTSKIIYKMPIDTGGLWVTFYPDVEIEKYINTGKKAHGVFKIGTEAVLWNGEKAPTIISVSKVKKDSIPAVKKVEEPPLLHNSRVVVLNEFGIEKAHQTYTVSEDTCFICLEEQKSYKLVGEVAVGVQIAPRRPLGDEQLQMSVVFEARYRYLGSVTNIPNSNGWNRLSLGVSARADYGPFVFQVRPKWTPGLGVGWTAGISYNLYKWAPKKGKKPAPPAPLQSIWG